MHMVSAVIAGLVASLLFTPVATSAERLSRQEGAQRIRDAIELAQSKPVTPARLAESEQLRQRFIEARLDEVRSRISEGKTDTPLFRLLITDLIAAGAADEVRALGVDLP